jgi:hypothetical protein
VPNLITQQQFDSVVQPRINDNLSPFLKKIFSFWRDVNHPRYQ